MHLYIVNCFISSEIRCLLDIHLLMSSSKLKIYIPQREGCVKSLT